MNMETEIFESSKKDLSFILFHRVTITPKLMSTIRVTEH